ncbi:hypothetical protein OF83DRAFT_1060194 [Amylostereum chailletii]|nr:hypothetical protein OF83DRAFT_1060194 [Amylostereum chailletii]
MSLDQNLFTLNITPNASDPSLVDLVDPTGKVHYHKQRELDAAPAYRIGVYDPLSQALLATASGPAATSKVKVIELHNPSHVVELKSVGTLSFKWAFKWEDHEFEWKREECYLVRKPDPAVLVAVTKEPAGRLRTTAVQILDYNLHRFDVGDRKGLEIVLLTALLTFHDLNDAYHAGAPAETAVAAPVPPPKPAPRVGIDRIAEMQAARGEVNEVTVAEEGVVEDYAEYAAQLLEDDAMLFITVRSASAAEVPKVLAVVEETKRIRHKKGLENAQDLHQYVVYDTSRPTRINLDDPAPGSNPMDRYAPPTNLAVHLSKIDMPELRPKPAPPKPSSSSSSSSPTPGYAASSASPAPPRKYPPARKASPSPSPTPPRTRKSSASALRRPASTPTPPAPSPPLFSRFLQRPQAQAQAHSPSPAQLSNPSVYVANAGRAVSDTLWGKKRR